MRRRVVITGLGVLSPNGVGVSAYWDALFAGRSGIGRLSLVDPAQHDHDCGGEVRDFDPSAFLSESQQAMLGRAAQLSLAAGQMALTESRLPLETLGTDRFAIYSGASGPVFDRLEAAVLEAYSRPDTTELNPLTIAGAFPHSHTVMLHELSGSAAGQGLTVSTACTSGTIAIGLGAAGIRDGRFDAVLCGAGESTFARGIFAAFESTGMMYQSERAPEEIMRPFNADRDGGVLSEGAAYVVLESLEHARLRGAPAHAEWLGSAAQAPLSGGPKDEVIRRGLRQVMQEALADAGLPADAVDYVSANAASVRRADAEEAQALWDVFGERTPRVPVSAIKSMIGNPVAAVGPLQIVAMCGSFARGLLPPTINLSELDPRCRLDVVANQARRNCVRVGLLNVRAMDGAHACVILGAPPPELVSGA